MKILSIGVLSFNTNGALYGDRRTPYGTMRKLTQNIFSNNIFSIDFAEPLKQVFKGVNIIAIALQESSIKNPKTNLCSDQFLQFFAKEFKDTHYLLIKKKKTGIGAQGIRGLRFGIFVSNDLASANISYEYYPYSPLKYSTLTASEGQQYGKGSIGFKLTINDFTFSLINSHLPFHGKLDDQGKDIRDTVLTETLEFYKHKSFLEHSYLFIGDLNYRVRLPIKEKTLTEDDFNKFFSYNKIKDTYLAYDDLKQTIESDPFSKYSLKEGVYNEGITFMPTSKLLKSLTRNVTFIDYIVHKENQKRTPSWTDRILYHNMACIKYNRFDVGNISMSDHAGVIGIFYTENTETN